MSDKNKHNGRRRDSAVEGWARALGVSQERLAALIEEVVEERQALGHGSAPPTQPTSPIRAR